MQKNQHINEVVINLKLNDLKKFFKKYTRSSQVNEKILSSSTNICCFEEITTETRSLFYYCEIEGKLIINNYHEENEDYIFINKDFFVELSNYSSTNFKIYFLDRELWNLVFCVFNEGEVFYSCENVSDWEDPTYFDNVPYFVEMAKSKGIRKKKDENGDKVWDSEEIYNLIYEFRDLLASTDYTYLKIAPMWFLNMQTISHLSK